MYENGIKKVRIESNETTVVVLERTHLNYLAHFQNYLIIPWIGLTAKIFSYDKIKEFFRVMS